MTMNVRSCDVQTELAVIHVRWNSATNCSNWYRGGLPDCSHLSFI